METHTVDLSCPKSVSVVIPAYNEEDSIYDVVSNTCEQLPNYFDDYEVIVVAQIELESLVCALR